MSDLIIAKGLSKSYVKAGVTIDVLRDADLAIASGETVAIIGVSGVGKSTLLHLLGGLDTPSAGSVAVDAIDIYALSDQKRCVFRNKHIGFIFQFHHLLNEFSARENVAMPALIWKTMPKKQAYARADELLVSVGLEHRLIHKPTELSGGEQQRVAIARAMMLKPRLILADEPTGNLDPKTGEAIHALMLDMQRREGTTLVYVTHNLHLISKETRVLRLEQGQVKDINGEADAEIS